MKKINWDNILKGFLIIFTILSIGFGIFYNVKAIKEREKRIAAQNELARQAKVFAEKEGLWSKLSQQREDIENELRAKNEELANLLRSRDERILALTDTIAKIRSTKIIIKERNIDQTEENERIRVSFDQVQDPIRISGFTLTNPPEATLEFSFVRPLRLRSVITQKESGQWVTYFESDWENLEIEEIETIVNPLNSIERSRQWYEGISIGANLATSGFTGLSANIFATYDVGKISFGPSLGISVSDEDSFANVGFIFQYKPFLEVDQ